MGFTWTPISKGSIITAAVFQELQRNVDTTDDSICSHNSVDSHDSVDAFDAVDAHNAGYDGVDTVDSRNAVDSYLSGYDGVDHVDAFDSYCIADAVDGHNVVDSHDGSYKIGHDIVCSRNAVDAYVGAFS